MSKMTVIKETANAASRYDILEFSELLEMIGRVAELKYRAIATMSLAEKVEVVLDDILQVVGVKRRSVTAEDQERSESDDDY